MRFGFLIGLLIFLLFVASPVSATYNYTPPGGESHYDVNVSDWDTTREIVDVFPDCVIDNDKVRHCVWMRTLGPLGGNLVDDDLQTYNWVIMYSNDSGTNGSTWGTPLNISSGWEAGGLGMQYPEIFPRVDVDEWGNPRIVWQRWEAYLTHWDSWKLRFSESRDGGKTFSDPVLIIPWGMDLLDFGFDDINPDIYIDDGNYTHLVWQSNYGHALQGNFDYSLNTMTSYYWRLFSVRLTSPETGGDEDDWGNPATDQCENVESSCETSGTGCSLCMFPSINVLNDTSHVYFEYINLTSGMIIDDNYRWGQEIRYTNQSDKDAYLSWSGSSMVVADGVYGESVPLSNMSSYWRPKCDADSEGDQHATFFVWNNTAGDDPSLTTDVQYAHAYRSAGWDSFDVSGITSETDVYNDYPDIVVDWRDNVHLSWRTLDSTGYYIEYVNQSAFNPDNFTDPGNASCVDCYTLNEVEDAPAMHTIDASEADTVQFMWHTYVLRGDMLVDYDLYGTSWMREFQQPLCGDSVSANLTLYGNVLDTNDHKLACRDDGVAFGAGNFTFDCDNYMIYGHPGYAGAAFDGVGLSLNGNNDLNIQNCTIAFFDIGINSTDADRNSYSNILDAVHGDSGLYMVDSDDNNFKDCTFSGSPTTLGAGLKHKSFSNVYLDNSTNNSYFNTIFYNSKQGGAVVLQPLLTNVFLCDGSHNNTFNQTTSFFTSLKWIHDSFTIWNQSHDNTITNSTVYNAHHGVRINNSNSTLVSNLSFSKNNYSIYNIGSSGEGVFRNNKYLTSYYAHINDTTGISILNTLIFNNSKGEIVWLNRSDVDVDSTYNLSLGLENLFIWWNNISFEADHFSLLQDGGVNMTLKNVANVSWGLSNLSIVVNDSVACTFCSVIDRADSFRFNATHFTEFGVDGPVNTSHPDNDSCHTDDHQVFNYDFWTNIEWNLTSLHPDKYYVERNGTVFVSSRSYSSNTPFNVSVNTTIGGQGLWNYTVFANNTLGNVTFDTVWINVSPVVYDEHVDVGSVYDRGDTIVVGIALSDRVGDPISGEVVVARFFYPNGSSMINVTLQETSLSGYYRNDSVSLAADAVYGSYTVNVVGNNVFASSDFVVSVSGLTTEQNLTLYNINSSVNTMGVTVNQINSTVNNISAMVSLVRLDLAEMNVTVNLINNGQSLMNITLNQVNFTLNQANTTINLMETTLNQANVTINGVDFTLGQANTTINEVQFTLGQLNVTANQLNFTLNQTNYSISIINNTITTMNNTLNQANVTVNWLNLTLNTTNTNLDWMNNTLIVLNNTLTVVNDRLVVVNMTVNLTNQNLQNVNTTVQLINTGIGQMNVTLNSANTTIFLSNLTLNQLNVTGNAILGDLNNKSRLVISDFDELNLNRTYQLRAWLFDSQGRPVAPSSVPRVTVYDPNRVKNVSEANMVLEDVGYYVYNLSINSTATAGVWESVVNVTLANGHDSLLNDFWEVESSPAEVRIIRIADATVSSISAEVNITNEGTTGYEYQYEYCVVSNINDNCGDGDNVAYASAAKYINTGVTWNTNLGLVVPTPGVYYFKVVVYYGTEKSGSSLLFTATNVTVTPAAGGGGSGGGKYPVFVVSTKGDEYAVPVVTIAVSRNLSRTYVLEYWVGDVNGSRVTGVYSEPIESGDWVYNPTLMSIIGEPTSMLSIVSNPAVDFRSLVIGSDYLSFVGIVDSTNNETVGVYSREFVYEGPSGLSFVQLLMLLLSCSVLFGFYKKKKNDKDDERIPRRGG